MVVGGLQWETFGYIINFRKVIKIISLLILTEVCRLKKAFEESEGTTNRSKNGTCPFYSIGDHEKITNAVHIAKGKNK